MTLSNLEDRKALTLQERCFTGKASCFSFPPPFIFFHGDRLETCLAGTSSAVVLCMLTPGAVPIVFLERTLPFAGEAPPPFGLLTCHGLWLFQVPTARPRSSRFRCQNGASLVDLALIKTLPPLLQFSSRTGGRADVLLRVFSCT